MLKEILGEPMFKKLSVYKKIIIPVGVLNIIMIIIVAVILQSRSQKSAVDLARDFSLNVIKQYKVVRSYYTANIVKSVKAHKTMAGY